MASQVDLDRKPSLTEWLAEDARLSMLLRDVWGVFREAYEGAKQETERRLGTGKPERKGGPSR